MERDKYGHYVNDKGMEINATTDKHDTEHISFYGSCPADDPNHSSIHINWDSESGKGKIIDTTGDKKETTDFGCYLTTACMKKLNENFNDNCEELTILRWFRDNFVSKEDIEHYYKVAPIIVEAINEKEDNKNIYNYIYENVIEYCVNSIKNADYNSAYDRYKKTILIFEEKFARQKLEKQLVRTLKLI